MSLSCPNLNWNSPTGPMIALKKVPPQVGTTQSQRPTTPTTILGVYKEDHSSFFNHSLILRFTLSIFLLFYVGVVRTLFRLNPDLSQLWVLSFGFVPTWEGCKLFFFSWYMSKFCVLIVFSCGFKYPHEIGP